MITTAPHDLGTSIRNFAAAAVGAPDIDRWPVVAEGFAFEVTFPENLTEGLWNALRGHRRRDSGLLEVALVG